MFGVAMVNSRQNGLRTLLAMSPQRCGNNKNKEQNKHALQACKRQNPKGKAASHAHLKVNLHAIFGVAVVKRRRDRMRMLLPPPSDTHSVLISMGKHAMSTTLCMNSEVTRVLKMMRRKREERESKSKRRKRER